jgi:transcriptional regulator with XRE-family HTH domain
MARTATTITPNQVIALNLKKLREMRKMTQEQAAEKLSQFLPGRWSKQAFSNAERSIEGKRIKQFNADEIIAIARAFEVTISDIFAPPYEAIHGRPVLIKQAGVSHERALEPHELELLVMGEVAAPRTAQEAGYAFALLIGLIEAARGWSPDDELRNAPGRRAAIMETIEASLYSLGLHPDPARAQGISRDLMRRVGSVADALDRIREVLGGAVAPPRDPPALGNQQKRDKR